MKNNKKVAIVVFVIIAAVTLGVIANLKRAWNLHEYAVANDCTWSWQGTSYGDDRDYVCK